MYNYKISCHYASDKSLFKPAHKLTIEGGGNTKGTGLEKNGSAF